MKKFAYVAAESVAEVIPLLDARSRPLAGGTGLLTDLNDALANPERLVSLRRIAGLRGVAPADGGLGIGALTTLSDLERDTALRSGPYAALAQAARVSASPQIRNAATIGGNLVQEVRCWYFRGPFDCWLKGGQTCYARAGEHHMHALFEQSPCIAVHPSDPATALLALDASVRLAGPEGERHVALLELLRPPEEGRRRLHALAESELIVGVQLPDRAGWRSTYQKAMERSLFSWALAGVAAAVRVEGGAVAEARIALGGVANTPLLAEQAAAALVGAPLTPEAIGRAAALAAEGARPLPQTAYKAELISRLVAAALSELV
ncbi:MAG TPA: FAD binding domain-containing protein [Roseiflexaceae bacterium]|nr:FAD binding domain-containing protein [Roseiflexaceae bacterium]